MERLELTDSERDQVEALAVEVIGASEDWDSLMFADRTGVVAERLPGRLREFLARVRATESDVTVVSNLPVSRDLEPTPTGWEAAAKTGAGRREEIVLMLCASGLGDPFGWANQQDGRVVHDVCPAPGQERSLTSASSEVALSLHTEDIFHPCRSDYVALFCLRNPDAVATTYVRVTALALPPDLAGVLGQDRFRFYPDDSHVGAVPPTTGDGDRLRGRQYSTGSVLFGPTERPYLRFDVDFMSTADDDDAARAAVRSAVGHLDESAERVVMRPGDAVFLDNYQVVHGREPFQPRYDGQDRWLKRLNVIRDVRRIYATSDRRSRILA